MSKYANKITGSAVGTIMNSDGALLLIQRQREPFIGKWALPGGKLEVGEHPSAAVVREFFEETGLKAEVDRFCGAVSELVPGEDGVSHFLMYVFLLRPAEGQGVEDATSYATEEGPLQWFLPEELPGIVVPTDLWMIQEFMQKSARPCLVEVTSTDTESILSAKFA